MREEARKVQCKKVKGKKKCKVNEEKKQPKKKSES